MCGIVGIASKNDCIDNIISGLYSLEYRGYDSSGLATIKNNHFEYDKNIGKISNLEKSVKNNKLSGDVVIAHTRWATHGKPSIKNCHPFIKDNCVLVHNGIIENYTDLINYYSIKQKNIKSETDSEIIAEIYNKLLNEFNNPIEAIKNLNKKIIGSKIDLAARKYLREINLDYAHGTGHGVGNFLNVHEGPQAISKNNRVYFEKGMVVSNEPGYYEKNKFGIRIENLIYVKKTKHKISFEDLTLVPIEKELINRSLLNKEEKKWLNQYHRKVFRNINKFMMKNEIEDLKKACSTFY